MMKSFLPLLLLTAVFSCSPGVREEAQSFLDEYSEKFQALEYDVARAQWLANTDIKDEHDSLAVIAGKAQAAYIGSREVIEKTRTLLARQDELDPIQVRQLKTIWNRASKRPGTVPKVVNALIEAETRQTSALFGFDFVVGPKAAKVSTNEIDNVLVNSPDLKKRLAYWTASKEVGKNLKQGLVELRSLRNQVAREMGYSSFFGLEVENYGMSSDEMRNLMNQIVDELRPLFIELHTYARYELAKRYNQKVPDYLPAHWLGNRWAQEWPGIVAGVNLDHLFKGKSKEWIVQQAESFYVSLGFPKLNQTFWDKSDLYPADAASGRKKNNHASAWHLNLDDDYRSLMSVEPNFRWFGTTHHELGHIYYFIEYARPEVPIVLREGANRGFHEGAGTLIELATTQRPYLEEIGLIKAGDEFDDTQWLLNQAFEHVVFIPFGAGTMTNFEYELYEKDLNPDSFNKTWWSMVKKYQGVVPPTERGEVFCDAATKTHINDDPAQYYDYVISQVLLFQLHNHIAKNILKQDPTNCNYFGNREVGAFLQKIMRPGATVDWRELLKETTGEELSASSMLEYFAPLMAHLKKVNKGRKKSSF